MAKKSAQEKLARAQRKAQKAQRAVIQARKAATPPVRQARPPEQPQPSAYTEYLYTAALEGDTEALRQLSKSGFLGYYVSELKHIIATSTNPGYRSWAASALDQLEPLARDQATGEIAKAAEVLATPGMGVEARAGASALLKSHGVDEHTAVEQARRPGPTGTPGPLRKAASPAAAVTVKAPLGDGRTVGLEMSAAEANGLVNAVMDALGRSAR
jgi:hypothetical protein